jgi:GNAT superfamily N-acetyltransferase
MMAYMRMFSGLPGVTTYDADSFWFISNRPAPGNIILRTRWQTDQIEERIDALLEEIAARTERIDWFVFPGDQPPDLGTRLEARGMPGGRGGNWLYTDLTALRDAPSVAPGFRIERVRDDQMLTEWVRVSEEGFEEELAIFYDAYARHGYGADAFSLHYTGYLGDTPVTSGTLLDAGGCASIYDVSTPPSFRGQGFGSAITHALMREIRDRGYADTWIWSSDTAKSVYEKLGYIDVDFGVREHTWQR